MITARQTQQYPADDWTGQLRGRWKKKNKEKENMCCLRLLDTQKAKKNEAIMHIQNAKFINIKERERERECARPVLTRIIKPLPAADRALLPCSSIFP